MHTSTRFGALLAAAVLALGGCSTAASSPTSTVSPTTLASTPSASVSAFSPSFASAPCPDDVTGQVVVPVTCGFLTVLEDRSKPAGRTIRLFVARFDPPGGTTTPDPVITLGSLATQDGYGDMAAAGQRTHRVLYLLDPRGIGHSIPSLDCPEVSAIAVDQAGLRLRDPARRSALLAAVTACHDRLAAQGIDLSAYGIGAHAADIEDLRVALGIKSWNLNTNGDASRVALEVARRYPGGVRSLIVDSPSVPLPDLLTVGPAALDLSISHVVAACAAEAACARKFPDAGAMIRNAITQLDSSPLTVDVSGTVDAIRLGHPIHLVVDGAALVRLIRAGLGGSGGASAGATLAMVQHVIDRKLGPDDAGVVGLSSDVGDCLGLRAICERPTLGVLYSMLCRDVAGAIDQAALTASIAGRPAYQDVFAPSPLIAPCDAWGIPTAAAESSPPPLTGGVPTLVMRGAFDPFSAPLPDVAAATAGSANVYLVDVPNQSYNVLGYTECPRAIRNAWIDAPTSPPDLSCLPNIPSLTLAP